MQTNKPHHRAGRRIVTAIVTSAAIAMVLAAPGFAKTVLACKASQLRLKFVSAENGWKFAFQHAGTACSLRGFPTVQLLNAKGKVLHEKVLHEPGFSGKKTVILRTGEATRCRSPLDRSHGSISIRESMWLRVASVSG